MRSGCVLKSGRIDQGDEEMGNKYSDLPFEPRSENIILLQPQTSVGHDKSFFLQPKSEEVFVMVYKDVVSLTSLVHITSVHCYNYESDPGKPLSSGPNCNGIITFKVATKETQAKGFGEKTQIVCSNPSCGMKLTSRLTIPEISNVMFHLMIKQMMPSLATCNYVDCSATEETMNLNSENAEKIRALGLISLSSKTASGVVQNGYFTGHENFSIGFTFMPGMNTINGCDGFDRWFRFLIAKKFEQLKQQHQTSLAALLGPKTRTKS